MTATIAPEIMSALEEHYMVNSEIAEVLFRILEADGFDFDEPLAEAKEEIRETMEQRGGRLGAADRDEIVYVHLSAAFSDYTMTDGRYGSPNVFGSYRFLDDGDTRDHVAQLIEDRLRYDIDADFLRNVVLPAWESGQSKADYIEQELDSNLEDYLDSPFTVEAGRYRTTYYVWAE